MIIDQTIDRLVAKNLLEKRRLRDEEHVPSGKLSASGLGKPTQWQVLKTLGVKPREIDEYVLRKFQRGNDVEDWLVSNLIDVVETQKKIEYKGVIGFADAIVDTTNYEFKCGNMVVEVKSTANSAYKYIASSNTPKPGHCLQAGLYALAEGHSHFGICYVASDDYRILTFVQETKKFAAEIEQIIAKYHNAIKNQTVPVFEPVEEWQRKEEYNDYPEWTNLSQVQINDKVKAMGLKWPEL